MTDLNPVASDDVFFYSIPDAMVLYDVNIEYQDVVNRYCFGPIVSRNNPNSSKFGSDSH